MTPHTLALIAAGILIFTGVVHTLAELFGARGPHPPELQTLLASMKSTRVPLPGREVSIYRLMRGSSLCMGLLFVGLGAIDLALALDASPTAPIPAAVLWINVAITGLGAFLAMRYFFVVPITLLGLACAGFIAALWV